MKKYKSLYCCFSVLQQKILESKNIKYEIVALSPTTKNTMWIYLRNEKLDSALNEWRLGSKN